MARRANLIECHNQGILAVGLECYMEVDCGTSRWEDQALPVLWDGFPSVLHCQVIPMWCEGCRKAAEGNGGKGEHREPMVEHGYRRPPNATLKKAKGSESP